MVAKEKTIVLFILILSLIGGTKIFAQTSTWVWKGSNGKLEYKLDSRQNRIPDFSAVGYKNSEEQIPTALDIPVVRTVTPVSGDDRSNVQNAINEVAAMPLQSNGFRGAILFEAGTYQINGSINITASGIVLRGEGDNTVFRDDATTAEHEFIVLGGSSGKSNITSTQKQITNGYVAIGATTINVESGHSFNVGDWVHIRRVPTSSWISLIDMDDMGSESWDADDYDVEFERQIKEVNGNTLTLDAPIVDPIDRTNGYATGYVVKINDNRIQNCGIENIRMTLPDGMSASNKNHGWKAICFYNIKNGWARGINIDRFGHSLAYMDYDASFITIENCSMVNPISENVGGNRYAYHINGQRCLVKNCYSSQGRHDCVNGSRVAGPSVFYNVTGEQADGDIGPHMRWSTGILFDNITNDKDMAVRNRWTTASGHGWAGSQIMFWNCNTPKMVIQDPKSDHMNWAIGCIAPTITNFDNTRTEPIGIVESQGAHITAIPSLFLAQLNDRLGTGGGNEDTLWTHDGPTVFNGTSDYVDGGTTPGSASNITVAFFMTADKLDNMGVVDKLPASGNSGWSVKLRSNGDLWFRVGSEATRTDLRTTGVYTVGAKVHIACTFGSGTAKLYVNGELRNTLGGITYGVNNTSTNLRLGIPSEAATTNIYDGTLEHVKIYSRVLSETEINELLNSSVWTHDGPTVFNGTSDYVEGGTTPGSSSNLTVAFFMTADKLASMGVADKLPASGNSGWSVKLRSNGDLWFRVGSEATRTDAIATGVYSAGTKVHIACTFGSGTAKIYVNGELRNTLGGITYGVNNTSTNLRLGIPSEAATTNIYDGMLEQVKIYDHVLSDVQISSIANGGLPKISADNVNKLELPSAYKLSQNYPNPFNPSTVIHYSLSSESYVKLEVFDMLGRVVTTLVDEVKSAGNYNVNFNAVNLSAGVYIYRLNAAGQILIKKMLLLK